MTPAAINYFTPLFFRLQQEGFLTRSCLATGLTEIRNADIGDKGRYYSGFFQLCIGIERISKLAIIIDHMSTNNLTPPGEGAIRSHGHRIGDLYIAAANISRRRSDPTALQFNLDPFCQQILDFLARFADRIRYANLDSLAKGTTEPNPLAEWMQILIQIIQQDVSKSKRDSILRESRVLAELMKDSAFVLMHDLDDQPLTLQTWLSAPRLQAEAARHATWHVVRLIYPLIELIGNLARSAISVDQASGSELANIPYMYEFYNFLWLDKQHILRKKRWP